jgi:hypothetical protein
MNIPRARTFSLPTGAWLLRLLLALCLGLCAVASWAQTDPPGRVGRLADARGAVSWWDQETGRWAEAERNQPLTGGDRLSTAGGGSAELRVGSTVLRLGESTELEVLRLDDERLAFQLHSGSVALRVRSREIADEIELVTAEARLQPLGAGHFRLDRTDDTTQASSWRGELRIDDPAGFVINTGQRVELFRDRSSSALRFQIGVPVNDRYAEAVLREDQRDERSVSARYVSPEMTGVEELDRNGRWEQHPEYGAVWLPLTVAAGWAPYSDGRWTWVQPWGWTWVDNARWGFAPFHYGRWAFWRSAWCWVPGAYVARPVYAPALVAWAGGRPGNGVRIGVHINGPSAGWLPLAPRQAYVPHHAVSPGYRERINGGRDRGPDRGGERANERWGDRQPGQPREGPPPRVNPGPVQTQPAPPRAVEPPRGVPGRDDRDERIGRDGRPGRDPRDNSDGRTGPNPRTAPPPTPPVQQPAAPAGPPVPRSQASPPPQQPAAPVGQPVPRAQPAVQPAQPVSPVSPAPRPPRAGPAPQAPQASPPAPPALPAAGPSPAVQRPREPEPERPREREQRRPNDREKEK